jgi:aryl-alcohol dehydrogenase-like predicted oxidoreductase
MEYRTIGESSLKLSVITFGAWAAGGWMWGGIETKDAIDAIRASYDLGVTSIDTAPVYGQGDSELVVAEAIKGLPRDKVQLLTKYGLRWDLNKGDFYFSTKDNKGKDIDLYKHAGKESIIEECNNSLRRLCTDYIDLYQVHWHDKTTPIQETMEAVQLLIRQGKVRYAGVCNYDTDQLTEARKHINIISDQVPYSMVRKDIEADTIPYCMQHSLSILAYSPLQRGLLTGKMKPGHRFSEGDNRGSLYYFSDENITRTNAFLEKIRPIAAEKNCSLSQLVLRWTIQQPGITVALVGARNAAQAADNAKAVNIKLNAGDLSLINSLLDELTLQKTS